MTRTRARRAATGVLVVALAATVVGLGTDVRSPPRYDGAGYSVLGLALATGRGYREIDRPDAPPHAHFPPGYPIALAAVWSVVGRSVVAAHLFSIACNVAACGLAVRWFRLVERPAVASLLGLALAVNWTWGTVGGSIQSEPLYMVLSVVALVLADRRRRGVRASACLGMVLGLCVLTRHVGVCLLAAVLVDRASRGRWREAATVGLTSALVVSPWMVWLATARGGTQAGLLDVGGLGPRVARQALFYARRLPDVLTGPFVEVATVFARSRAIGLIATAGAVLFSAVLLVGLVRAAVDPRRRLAGLVPLATLSLLLAWPFTEAGRFLTPLVPCLLVAMVEGVSGLAGWIGRGLDKLKDRKRVAAGLLLMAAIPYIGYSLATGRSVRSQRLAHAEFDAACDWIATRARRPGPILTRHPGEVFWQTGRPALSPASDDPDVLARQIDAEGVAYLLVDPDRYADAPPTPLARYVAENPGRMVAVRPGGVSVYEVRRDSGP